MWPKPHPSVLCGVARAQPITGQLATPLATQQLRYRLSAEKWHSLFGGVCTLQKLVSVEQKSQQYRQELAQVKKDLHKAQQEAAEHKQATHSCRFL